MISLIWKNRHWFFFSSKKLISLFDADQKNTEFRIAFFQPTVQYSIFLLHEICINQYKQWAIFTVQQVFIPQTYTLYSTNCNLSLFRDSWKSPREIKEKISNTVFTFNWKKVFRKKLPKILQIQRFFRSNFKIPGAATNKWACQRNSGLPHNLVIFLC